MITLEIKPKQEKRRELVKGALVFLAVLAILLISLAITGEGDRLMRL